MATDNKMNEKKLRLLSLLREMFQLDQPDLDFGLYRIMHAKRAQVETFLESEFDQLIDKVFASRGARQEEAAKQEYEAARRQAIEFGAPDPEAAPKVQQARARYDAVRLTGGEDAEIYDHLHRFFSRYYDEGDFMSLRRYGKGAAGGAEAYAVPYDGSEVVLHWANKDQYYIKTTENFAEFSFDPRKALQKDERGISRQLFDAAASGQTLKVHFRIVDAAEGAHNNVKASDKDERYFILDDETPIAWEGTELVVRINYRPDSERQKGKWQEKRNDQLVQKVLDALAGVTGDGKALADEYRSVLSRDVPKGKDKKQPLLARYVGQYTASNTMDYFIHKDLGGFLLRELDFYLKNEVLKLDDFVGSEDADVQAGLTDAQLKAVQAALEKAQAIRLLSQRLIDFLAQLEDFQRKLWLKKKFVVETHYCITLNRIPVKFYPEIAANDLQREEWVRLFAVDEIKGNKKSPAYSVPLSVEFLKANPKLPVDTRFFDNSFAGELAGSLDSIDEISTGTFFNGENHQTLNLITSQYASSIRCIYIDPPYNTENDEFLYKDNYRRSSWLSMMADRLKLARELLREDGVLYISIDDKEVERLKELCVEVFGRENILNVFSVKTSDPSGHKTVNPSPYSCVEYVLMICKNRQSYKYEQYYIPAEYDQNYRFFIPNRDEPPSEWRFDTVAVRVAENLGFDSPASAIKGISELGFVKAMADFALANADSVFQATAISKDAGSDILEGKAESQKNPSAVISVHREKGEDIHIRGGRQIYFYRNKLRKSEESKTVGPTKPLTNLWADIPWNGIANEGGVQLKNGKKPEKLLFRLIKVLRPQPQDIILDFFSGSATTAAVASKLGLKWVVVEQSHEISIIALERLKRVMAGDKSGISDFANESLTGFRVLRIESYEDCLNNLGLNRTGEAISTAGDSSMQRDYLLRYMLDVETQGSQSLLNVTQFRDPAGYQVEIKKPGSDERANRNVDLVETFNWLIGLHVDRLHAGRRFAAAFVRKPDPLLPKDANTRLQAKTLIEAEDGAWWFRPVEGYVRTKPGDDRHRQSVLVLWRTLTDDPEQDAAVLEAFLAQQMKFDPSRREDKTLYDIIYINGTHNLPNLGKYGEVRLLEEEFHRRMWAGEES